MSTCVFRALPPKRAEGCKLFCVAVVAITNAAGPEFIVREGRMNGRVPAFGYTELKGLADIEGVRVSRRHTISQPERDTLSAALGIPLGGECTKPCSKGYMVHLINRYLRRFIWTHPSYILSIFLLTSLCHRVSSQRCRPGQPALARRPLCSARNTQHRI